MNKIVRMILFSVTFSITAPLVFAQRDLKLIPAPDRVVVVEDVDHDGVADKTHVFADGLLIPAGVTPGDGGVWVANSTELLHFADHDGDLKADSKRVVLSGFGTEDTHHILHTLRWGYDGFLYFNQSIYIHSHVEIPWGVRRQNAE